MEEGLNYLPVDNIEYDKLGFEAKASEIASFISTFPSYLPYAIAINGPWGSGKSSMLNFIEQSLDQDKCSIIRFNPWLVTDRESLIDNLFEEIYYEIDGGFTNTKQKFAEYAQKLIPSATKLVTYFGSISQGADPRTSSVISGSAGEAAKGIGDILFDKPLSKRKKELHEEMAQTYSDTNKKIVVMIDELDRLFPDEIITVFQMIKSTLDFPGLFFVVAMDNTMIFEALEKRGISKPTYYLEKIFQRNYFVRTKNQIETLAENFLLPYLDDGFKIEKKLKDCIEAYIFLDSSKYATFEFSIFSDRLGNEWEFERGDEKGLTSSYRKVANLLSQELNLANPRTFINFATHIKELWPNYYKNVVDKDNNDTFRMHAAFLILLCYMWYPNECDINMFGYTVEKTEKQPFIKQVNEHFDFLLPKYKSKQAPNSFTYKKLDNVIRESILYLNQFPDYLRRLKLRDETIET